MLSDMSGSSEVERLTTLSHYIFTKTTTVGTWFRGPCAAAPASAAVGAAAGSQTAALGSQQTVGITGILKGL